MVSACLYFQVHQPYRLNRYRVFDIGNSSIYFDEQKNREILNKVAAKCYLPANKVMRELLESHPEFRVAFSFSGVLLEQLEKYNTDALQSFQDLVDTGRVEILDETYHHSLSFLFSKEEFREQVLLHRKKIQQLFGQTPRIFRNTELVYNNELARFVEGMGYEGVLAEGWDPILEWRSPNMVYRSKGTRLGLLLKNYRLSDDIAFRFSNNAWEGFPLTPEKYAGWLNAINGSGQVINLFMDYETFGEHQWGDTGIFNFLRRLPAEFLKSKDNDFVTPSEALARYPAAVELDIHNLISWADTERDLSAWMGNKMQQSALNKLYLLEKAVKESNDPQLLDDWRRLQTSDHFYYMCTKWFNDGDVHKYFNPYDNPYDCFIAFMNIFNDLLLRIEQKRIKLNTEK